MASLQDDFNRADGALGASWSNIRGANVIASNRLAWSSGSGAYSVAVGTYTADQYAECDVYAETATTEGGVTVLTSGGAAPNCYRFGFNHSTSAIVVERIASAGIAQTWTTAATRGAVDRLRLEARVFGDRTELTCYRNGALVTGLGTNGVITDTNANRHTSGSPGVFLSTGAAGTIDNFDGGDIAAAAAPTISSVTPTTFTNGQTGIVITGTGFGATQGAGQVRIGTSNSNPATGAVAQAVTAWSDTSITITAVQGALPSGSTVFLYVTENGGTSNSTGFPVSFGASAAQLIAAPRRQVFVIDKTIQH